MSLIANIRGPAGKSVLHGAGAPSDSLGQDGEFYIDTDELDDGTLVIYGPKTSGAWGSPVTITGDGEGGPGIWGQISGTLANQTDLQTALNLKAAASALTSHTGNTSNPHSTTQAQVGLANVDNTSDANKPVSTAQAIALALKAPLASPAFTGAPTAPTPSPGDNSTKLPTTAFVQAAITALINLAPGSLDTLGELATQMAADESGVAALTTSVSGKLAKSSNLSDLTNVATALANLSIAADPAAGTAGLRSLGTTSAKACAGNDARLSDARTPTAHAASHAADGSDPVSVFGFEDPDSGFKAEVDATALTADRSIKLPDADSVTVVPDESEAGDFVTGVGEDGELIFGTPAAPSEGVTFNNQTGASYTPVLGDANKWVTMNNASANTLTVPPNSDVAFPVGTQLTVSQKGAGLTSIAAGTGVTVNSRGDLLDSAGQHAVLLLVQTAADDWLLTGDLA